MGHNRNLADYAHHFDGTNIDLGSGNIETEGVVTYEDVTNVDSVGIITARAGVKVPDNQKIFLGDGDDLQIFHNGNHSVIADVGTGNLQLRAEDFRVTDSTNAEVMIRANTNAEVELYYNNSKKLETTTTGATVTGTLVSDGVTSELDLTAISSSISDTAVDVFVYDTRKDSDGGAWRKRTQHTSWYNETLNTSIRGSRKEFPAVAVIVCLSGYIKIYDGDDPDLPFWMEIRGTTDRRDRGWLHSASVKAASALNGIIALATYGNGTDSGGTHIVDFIKDDLRRHSVSGGRSGDGLIITQRGTSVNLNVSTSLGLVVSELQNDVAMTVLPNAPIDDETGLPVPTIAAATNDGVSVIKDDGTVVDIVSSYVPTDNSDYVEFTKSGGLVLDMGHNGDRSWLHTFDVIPSVDTTVTVNTKNAASGSNPVGWYDVTNFFGADLVVLSSGMADQIDTRTLYGDTIVATTDLGMTLIDEYAPAPSSGMTNFITTSYNTGWMNGNIKGAFLSDTDTTNVTGSELITNTDFASDLSGWTNGNPSQFTRVTNNVGGDTDGKLMYYATDGVLRTFYQYVTCVAGEKYVLSLRACSDTASAMVIDIDGTNVITIDDNNNAAFITKQYTFTAGSTSVRIRIESAAANRSYFTDFSVRLAEEDRSVNNKGLQVFGTITKSAVATGAELVSYSGWSSSNYLIQPYNSDLNFGTGNWCYMFWYNPNDAESGDVIFSRWSYNVDSNQGPRLTAYFNSGNLRFDTADASAGSSYQGHFGSDGTQDSNEWHCAVILRRGPNLEIWIDGKNYKTATLNSTSDGSYTDTNAILEIGHSPNSGAPEAGLELALFRVSGTAPSPEQIKKIYEDEKFLFQENAKATLYGSSDAVTALAYDEDTELLHVGTSAGRSDFQGLRRINNTTTAVTTAISASDELIAEQ